MEFPLNPDMPSIYVSGPFSDEDNIHGVARNILVASEHGLRLVEAGWNVYNPMKAGADYQHTKIDKKIWMRMDFCHLWKSDAIFMLPGWQRSEGARDEYEFARTRLNFKGNSIRIFEYPDGIPAPEELL